MEDDGRVTSKVLDAGVGAADDERAEEEDNDDEEDEVGGDGADGDCLLDDEDADEA